MAIINENIEIPAKRLFEMFKKAHLIANNPPFATNDDVQNECVDLVCELAGYVKDFELKMSSKNEELPYNDSILNNPDYDWYVNKY